MKDVTRSYYNSVSDSLQNKDELYYNGALIVDLNSSPETFIDQDINNIIRISNIKQSSKILECGCGSGYFFKKLIQKLPNIEYNGIDLSDVQIKNARLLNPDHSEKFSQSDWNNIPFDDNSFDNIIFLETIGYTKDVDKMLSECFRVLNPGGTLFTKHPGCLNETYHHMTQTDSNLKALNNEYGYAENSLGMMMNVPKFVGKLEEHGFIKTFGPDVPLRDESLYIKTHFIDEVHECFETVRVNKSYVSARYPNGEKKEFLEKLKKLNQDFNDDNILSDLGKKHPILVNFFRNKSLIEKNIDLDLNPGQDIMSPCVLIAAIKP